jgi:acetylserotonin N-methyltransferase
MTTNLPDASRVLELIEAFRHSKTMFTALSMGVFDALHGGPATAEALSARLGANAGALGRLLDGCAALHLLGKRDGTYENSEAAETYLYSGSPHSLSGYIRYSDQALYPMWGNLGDAVREGTPRWSQNFGIDGPIFSAFFRTPEAMHDFLMGMHGFGMLTSPKVAAAFDLSRFRRLVDLGGATGHLTIAACELYPEMHGVVFDLQQAVGLARELVAGSAASARIEVIAGDFFTDSLPAADLYYTGRILHDWSEDKIERLLARIMERLPAGGGLLIGEKLLGEDGVGPLPANMQSLNMLVVTEGRERSLSEYRVLLERAGFRQVEGRRTGAALDAILAIK